MFLITNDFFKKVIDLKQKKKIIEKCSHFADLMIEKEMQIRTLPKGYWVRKIKNTDIFKFRLKSEDRILFTYINDDRSNSTSILFLDYCTHDKQILRGKSISVKSSTLNSKDFQIDKNYEDDEFDNILESNNKFITDYKNKGFIDLESLTSIVVEDSYIAVLMNNDNEDYLYYLTQSQFDCVKDIGKPIIVTGAAGSGKTTVALHKLLAHTFDNLSVGYITYTELLSDNAKRCFDKFKDKKSGNYNASFYYIHQFYSKTLAVPFDKIATYKTFKSHVEQFDYKNNKILKKIDLLDIYTEYRGILKGYLGLQCTLVSNLSTRKNNMITLDEYINIPDSYSIFNKVEKTEIYNLCSKYSTKIESLGFKDENDLAIEAISAIDDNKIKLFDYLIVDEVQDLSEVQIYMLSKLVKNPNQIMFSGDIHQIINPTFFNFGRLKNIYYGLGFDTSIHTLSKNYRNPIEVINILNSLTMDRQKYIGKTKYDYIEHGVVNGVKPTISKLSDREIKELLNNVSKRHYCAIIVSNIEEKNKLIKIYKDAEDRIFLVNEIKGLEYDNVYCFNIVSSYNKDWIDIYNGFTNGNSKYRYFFNILYVALSRSRKNLFIYEDNLKNPAIQNILGFAKQEKVFSKENLKIEKISTKQDWIKESKRLEKVGNLEKATFARNISEENAIIQLNKIMGSEGIRACSGDINTQDILNGEDIVSSFINDAFKLYQFGKCSDAIEIYNKALELDKDNYLIYHYIANCFSYMANGMIKSLEYYDWCLNLKEDYIEAHLDRAAVAKNIPGYTQNAIDTLEKAYKYHPNLINICTLLGDLYFDLYNLDISNNKENTNVLDKAIYYYKLGLKCTDSLLYNASSRYWSKDINNKNLDFLRECCIKNLEICEHITSPIEKVEQIIYEIFSAADNELHSSLDDYLLYKIQNASIIENSVLYFKYFTSSILEKIESYFETNNYPSNKNEFIYDYTNLARDAKFNYTNSYKYSKNMDSKSYEYQLAYYEVYCNAYIRYALIDFFDNPNQDYISILKSINTNELIIIIDKVISELTLNKLEDSFGKNLINL